MSKEKKRDKKHNPGRQENRNVIRRVVAFFPGTLLGCARQNKMPVEPIFMRQAPPRAAGRRHWRASMCCTNFTSIMHDDRSVSRLLINTRPEP